MEQTQHQAAGQGNPGQDPQAGSTEGEQFFDGDTSQAAGQEGGGGVRSDHNAVVLADQHGHGHVVRINAELLANTDGQRQQAEEVGVGTQHHADGHGEESEYILQMAPEQPE